MPSRTALQVDFDTPAWEQEGIHNRWHPDIPFVGQITPGEVVHIECLDCLGGAIRNDDCADDARNGIPLMGVHYLSGPFEIEGAQPGDMLLVEIQDVQPFAHRPWGFTAVLDRSGGGGFLDNEYPQAAKAIWDFEGIFCSSRHIPGVRFSGIIHPGIMGCAPSAEVLAEWNRRESELVATPALLNERNVALLPDPCNAHAGAASGELRERIGREGARTIPGRPENGGNCDIKNLSRGSKVYLPVHVNGAGFSVGDLHFSQGDGEIALCGAIEMAGIITLKFELIRNGMETLGMKHPVYIPGPVQPQFSPGRMLTFEGFSVDEEGRQHYLDVNVAYKQACLRVIEYLKRFGYSGEQIYLLLSAAPIEGHIGAVVDFPNACVSIGLPMDIFDFDISPAAAARDGGVQERDLGSCAYTSDRR